MAVRTYSITGSLQSLKKVKDSLGKRFTKLGENLFSYQAPETGLSCTLSADVFKIGTDNYQLILEANFGANANQGKKIMGPLEDILIMDFKFGIVLPDS